MTNIYFARHGESEWNILRKVQGQVNSPLTDRGIKQAELLAKRLADFDIDVIYSSDLDRAYETACKIADYHKLEVIKDEDLREMSFGDWEGQFMDDIIKNENEGYMMWIKTPDQFRIPAAESLEELRIRMEGSIEKIIKKHEGKNILIVSHGTALKMATIGLLGLDDSNYKNLTMGNTALTNIELRDFNNVLKLYNSTEHLGDMDNE